MHTTDNWGTSNPRNVKGKLNECRNRLLLPIILTLGLAGCGLAIAYTSDENTVRPEDFTVFSVEHECPWKRKVNFPVPADLPACPEGGCLCE